MQEAIDLLPWVLLLVFLLRPERDAVTIEALSKRQEIQEAQHIYLTSVVADLIEHPPKGKHCTRQKIALEAELEKRKN
ncbi:MAG: hypothetical protein ACRBFS_10515 [Aureispira sp.]